MGKKRGREMKREGNVRGEGRNKEEDTAAERRGDDDQQRDGGTEEGWGEITSCERADV